MRRKSLLHRDRNFLSNLKPGKNLKADFMKRGQEKRGKGKKRKKEGKMRTKYEKRKMRKREERNEMQKGKKKIKRGKGEIYLNLFPFL